MSNEDKFLLTKDLCGRLQYGVIVHNSYNYFDNIEKVNKHREEDRTAQINDLYNITEIKPYLRPMSSMTQKECIQLSILLPKYYIIYSDQIHNLGRDGRILLEHIEIITDFYNSHHLDWRGLIPKGLALEAPKEMCNY